MSKILQIKMELLENGLDFIDNSLNPILTSDNQHDLKYSILHLSAGIELILKEVLKNEHWALIFEDINKAEQEKLRSGDFQSASFETIVKRIQNIAGMDIPESSLTRIRNIRKVRNKIEHFAFEENPNALKSSVSKVLCDIIDIIKRCLNLEKYSEEIQVLYNELILKTSKFDEYVKIRMAKLKVNLEATRVDIMECPRCHQLSLPLNENLKCMFCEYHDSPENVAAFYLEEVLNISIYATVKDGGDDPIYYCPDCGDASMIRLENGNSICFNCLEQHHNDDLAYCSDCGTIITVSETDEIYLCNDCIDNRWHE